jgi:hypothetical protein
MSAGGLHDGGVALAPETHIVAGAEAFGRGGGLAVLDGALGHIGRITDFGSIGKEIVGSWGVTDSVSIGNESVRAIVGARKIFGKSDLPNSGKSGHRVK